MPDIIAVATRSGRKVHAASPSSSVTYCGRWLKVLAVHMEVSGPVTCLRCLRAMCPYCAPDEPCAIHVVLQAAEERKEWEQPIGDTSRLDEALDALRRDFPR